MSLHAKFTFKIIFFYTNVNVHTRSKLTRKKIMFLSRSPVSHWSTLKCASQWVSTIWRQPRPPGSPTRGRRRRRRRTRPLRLSRRPRARSSSTWRNQTLYDYHKDTNVTAYLLYINISCDTNQTLLDDDVTERFNDVIERIFKLIK